MANGIDIFLPERHSEIFLKNDDFSSPGEQSVAALKTYLMTWNTIFYNKF